MIQPIKNLRQFRELCLQGREDYRKLAVGAAKNIGMNPTDWQSAFAEFDKWMLSMVGEYDHPEDQVERDLIDEINHCI